MQKGWRGDERTENEIRGPISSSICNCGDNNELVTVVNEDSYDMYICTFLYLEKDCPIVTLPRNLQTCLIFSHAMWTSYILAYLRWIVIFPEWIWNHPNPWHPAYLIRLNIHSATCTLYYFRDIPASSATSWISKRREMRPRERTALQCNAKITLLLLRVISIPTTL